MDRRTLIYALGGGTGHLTRALQVAARLGGRATVLHQAERAPPIPDRVRLVRLDPGLDRDGLVAWLLRELEHHDALVVDTFPGGIAHELPDALFGRRPTTLVARALIRDRYPDYDALAARFDEVWLPYPADRTEWDEPPPGRWIGALAREIRVEAQRRVPLLVIGDPASAPPGWAPLLERAAVVNGPFHTLPAADRVVALAAGYNLAWELHRAGIAAAYRPLPRRFDDQHRRAALLGTPLAHRADLAGFLARGP